MHAQYFDPINKCGTSKLCLGQFPPPSNSPCLGVLGEPGEGRLAALAVLQDQSPVPLGQGGEGHGEGLAPVQSGLSPKYPGSEMKKFRSDSIFRTSLFALLFYFTCIKQIN